jgi:hypothetical protein
MVKRSRSVPAPSTIDRDMLHQVALPDDLCTGHNFTLIDRFLREHAMVCRTRAVIAAWDDGKQEQWRPHCFADCAAAAAFLDHFGGAVFDPKRDRQNGRIFILARDIAMDQIIALDSRQEAALQKVADRFVSLHKGDTMKALKEMIVLNDHPQDEIDTLRRRRNQ